MTVRFLADENLDTGIIMGLRAREPAIDILDVKTAGLRGTADPTLLEIAAQQDRVLITYEKEYDAPALSRSHGSRKANSRRVHPSPAAKSCRRNHRIARSRVGGITSRRMA